MPSEVSDLTPRLDARWVHSMGTPHGAGFVIFLDRAGTRVLVPATPEALPVLYMLERKMRTRSEAEDRRTPVGAWLRAVADHTRGIVGVLRRSRRARL